MALMDTTRMKYLIGLVLALGIGAAAADSGAEAPLSKEALEASRERVEAQAKAQRKACDRFKGNARGVCQAEARGWEKVAEAQLEAQHQPGPEAEKNVKFAKADADYGVAKQRCQALKDRAKDHCTARAKHEREAAVRLAKVEKVEEVRQLKRAEAQARRAALKAASRS